MTNISITRQFAVVQVRGRADAVQTHMTNSRLTDPEVLEWRYPVLLHSFEIRKNSGGAGKYTGGNGVVRRIKFLEPMEASILALQRVHSPFGLNGGTWGRQGEDYIVRTTGAIEELFGPASVRMNAGDVFVIRTPGGGGYGEPEPVSMEMPPDEVVISLLRNCGNYNWVDRLSVAREKLYSANQNIRRAGLREIEVFCHPRVYMDAYVRGIELNEWGKLVDRLHKFAKRKI